MLLGRKAIGTVAYMGGIPAVLENFCWSWGQMVQHNEEMLATDKEYIHYTKATISDHGPARNSIVASFLGNWCVMMDCDHQFEPDIIARLVRTADEYDIDVLSGVYQLKTPPHIPVLFQWVKIGDGVGLQPLASWPKDCRVVEIGSAGGGCLFVRRKVFDAIYQEFKCGAFDKTGPYSEDHSFFWRCRELGIKCYAAMNIHCNHLRVAPVTMDDFDGSGLNRSEEFAVGGFA